MCSRQPRTRAWIGRPVEVLFGCRRYVRHWIVQNDAFERIAIIFPCGPLQRPHRIGVACFPAKANAAGAEVDIFGVVFIVEPGREQPHDVHLRLAAILGQILDDGMWCGRSPV